MKKSSPTLRDEKINVFKEVTLLVSFLILLFSFSNKTFANPVENNKKATEQVLLLKSIPAVVADGNNLPVLTKCPVNKLPGSYFTYKTFGISFQNKKIIDVSHRFIKRSLLLKPENLTRFYYRFFSPQEEEFPC